MTKWQLFNAFSNGSTITLNGNTRSPITGIIDSIQREDGSEHCWNVTVRTFSHDERTMVGVVTVFVRTVD